MMQNCDTYLWIRAMHKILIEFKNPCSCSFCSLSTIWMIAQTSPFSILCEITALKKSMIPRSLCRSHFPLRSLNTGHTSSKWVCESRFDMFTSETTFLQDWQSSDLFLYFEGKFPLTVSTMWFRIRNLSRTCSRFRSKK